MSDTFLFDFEEPNIVCGIDEAGRGPLAGPVVAAAVILPADFPISMLDDSKKLTESQRTMAEIAIKEQALYWAVGCATAQEIDRINILQATFLAMKRAFTKIRKQTLIDLALVDGNQKPPLECAIRTVVKGDATIPEIMAASILAKNARDRYMALCDKKWPLYQFAKHKGYPTKEHRDACLFYGLSPIHRKTFHVDTISRSNQESMQSLF